MRFSAQLGGHKNLGIHTEMFADGVLPLVEKRRDQRRSQENRPRQDGLDLPDGFESRLRLHRRQPGRADDGCRIHERPLHHLAERPLRGHQLGPASRPDGPGVRRLAGHEILVGRRRTNRLRLRRIALEGRQGDHRHAFDHQQGRVENLPDAVRTAPAW